MIRLVWLPAVLLALGGWFGPRPEARAEEQEPAVPAAGNPSVREPEVARATTETVAAAAVAKTGADGTERPGADCSTHSEAKIRAALHDATTMEFTETPLQDVVDYLRELHGIRIQLDIRAMGDAGVAPDTPVTRVLNGISLDSALRLLLSDLDLTAVITRGVLLITTPEAARRMIEVRMYAVGDLIDKKNSVDDLAVLFEVLLTPQGSKGKPAAESKTGIGGAPQSEAREADPSTPLIMPFQKLLLVRAPIADHDELTRLIGELREKVKADR